MRTVPHVPWQIKPIRLPKSREAEIMDMLEDQCQAGKYELSSSSYRSAVFAIELFSRNMAYFTSDFERKTLPPGSITDITYDGYLYRESSNIESDTPPTAGSFEIFECSMAIYGCEDNYRGRPCSRSTGSHNEKRRYSRNYSPVRYRRPPPPHRGIHREYQSYRPDYDNSPYHRYPKRRDNSPIDRSVSPRARAHENSLRDSRDTSCHTSGDGVKM